MNTRNIMRFSRRRKRLFYASGNAPRKFSACLSAAVIWGVLVSGAQSPAAESSTPNDWVKSNMSSLVELYRHLHQTPELSLKEKETSARMAKELKDLGVEVTTNVGGYGAVGVLKN